MFRNDYICDCLYDVMHSYMRYFHAKNGRFSVSIYFHHTTCESTCDTLSSSAANQGDNTVLVTQGGTATPGKYIYTYIYTLETNVIYNSFSRIIYDVYAVTHKKDKTEGKRTEQMADIERIST